MAAIGSPFNEQSSLSVGVVSATDRTIDSLTSGYSVSDAIQTDAPINRGNSGGPLFDARGRVIGINAQIRSTSGTAEGVGFAIPIDTARRALEQLVRTGKVVVRVRRRHDAGRDARASRRSSGSTRRRGALIAKVEPGTPAARAGLRGGTRTVDYNGLEVSLGGDLIVRHRRHAPSTSAQRRLACGDTARSRASACRSPSSAAAPTRRVVQVTLAERPA